MSEIRHRWGDMESKETGRPCVREGCPCRKRFRDVSKPYGSKRRLQFSNDRGATWDDLEGGFSGRVPECRGVKP